MWTKSDLNMRERTNHCANMQGIDDAVLKAPSSGRFKGVKGSPRDLRGEIGIPPDPLACSYRRAIDNAIENRLTYLTQIL